MHPCELIYHAASSQPLYGDTPGTCRVLGKTARGMAFERWVKDTFTNLDALKPGNIISNEALFCFDESSALIQQMTGRDKPQKFRTYSHFVAGGQWRVYTKANKREMYQLLLDGAEVAVMSDSGQKHLVFKHRMGFWQLEDQHIRPDRERLQLIHQTMRSLVAVGFSQTEVITGEYLTYRILKAGMPNWKPFEDILKQHRGAGVFDVAAWLLFSNETQPQP